MNVTITPEEISAVLKRHIEAHRVEISVDEIGEVIEAGDGIARIKGLPNAMASEMLQFDSGIYGMVLFLLGDSFETLHTFLILSAVAMLFFRPKRSEFEEYA